MAAKIKKKCIIISLLLGRSGRFIRRIPMVNQPHCWWSLVVDWLFVGVAVDGRGQPWTKCPMCVRPANGFGSQNQISFVIVCLARTTPMQIIIQAAEE